MTPLDAEQEILRQLDAGERLLWSGVPKQGIFLRGSDAFMIPFSLLWCGFAIFWETLAITKHAPLLFRLWGVPFVLFGLYMAIGRFFGDAWMRSKVAYGLTDRRVVILSGITSRSVQNLDLQLLVDMTLQERSDGVGTIRFGPSTGYPDVVWPAFSGRRQQGPAFEFIASAREVYGRIRAARASSS